MITLRPSLGSLGSSSVWMRSSSVATRRLGLVDLLAHELAVVARRLGQHLAGGRRRPRGPTVRSCQARTISPSSLWRRDRSRRRSGSRERGRVGQLGLDGVVLRLERGHPVVEHAVSGCSSSGGGGRGGMRPVGRPGQSCAAGAGLAFALPLRSP